MLRVTSEVVEAVEPDHEALHMPGEHLNIIEAIINGKEGLAKKEMKKHVEKFSKSLIQMEKDYRKKMPI